MSANLINSVRLSTEAWFTGLVRAALVEYSLAHPDDALARTLIRDPAFMLPMFVAVVADNPSISADSWLALGQGTAQQQGDVRYALASSWAALRDALPNLTQAGG